MIATEINVDEDATDEEVEEVVPSSDEEVEKDAVIFDSEEDNDNSEEDDDYSYEDDDDSYEDDDNSYEDDDSEDDTGSESNYQEAEEDSPTKSKDNKLKSKNKSLIFKSKTSTSREITPVIKLNSKSHKDETCKDDACDKQDTKNISNNVNDEDEYVYDSSDEEDIRNTVGNVPMKWYDEYDHLGYDWEGKKIPKPEKGDELDNFLKIMEDPDFWRTIKDPQTGRDVVLNEADIDLIVRIQKQKVPDAQFNEYAVS